MKSIVNKTRRPIKVPLPRGKVLHLGPSKTGQINDQAVEFPAVQRLVEAGEIAVLEGSGRRGGGADAGAAPHESTHGHHPPVTVHKSGDR